MIPPLSDYTDKKVMSAKILVFQVFFRIQVNLEFKSISLQKNTSLLLQEAVKKYASFGLPDHKIHPRFRFIRFLKGGKNILACFMITVEQKC